jgi:hypothetical protein
VARRGETAANHLRMKALNRAKLLNADVYEVEGHLYV